ncbi:MAG: response regulator [Deferribacteraceae bacterium]|jgi:CheY-like chemotaxis protein|nr:response regulator [Deferribacteraceae bacterium]
MNILIADDELRLRKVLAMFLRKNNYEVLEAVSGEQVLEMLENVQPDVIVLDVRMAELSGVEVTDIIKKDPARKDIPIILLTANVSSEERESGLKAGAAAYMTKPFSPKELLEKIVELTAK